MAGVAFNLGAYLNPTVTNLQGNSVSAAAPSDGRVLTFNGSQWLGAFPGSFAPGGRLTLTSGTPLITSDVTAATSVYYTPYLHDAIDLYDGTAWRRYQFAELTLSIAGYTAGKNFDIWCVLSAGVPSLASDVWTGDVTRATAISRTNGRLTKTGDLTRLYLGTIRTTATTGQTEISFGLTPAAGGSQPKCYIYNEYNKVLISFYALDSTDSWGYATSTWRSMNAGGTGSGVYNRFTFVNGNNLVVSGKGINLAQANSQGALGNAFGVDSTSTPYGAFCTATGLGSGNNIVMHSIIDYTPSVGIHFIQELEYGGSGATIYGDAGQPSIYQSGAIFTTTY